MSDYLLVLVMNLDALFACGACAASGIYIPLRSRVILALCGCTSLALSLSAGNILATFLSTQILHLIAFSVLFFLGISNLLHQLMQSVLSRCQKISIHAFQYIIDICLDETRADADHSQHLSAGEALALALPLSTDSLLTGMSMTESNPWILLLLSFCCGILFTTIGSRLYSAHKSSRQLRPLLCGIFFLILAFGKLL